MKKALGVAVMGVLLAVVTITSADVFNMGNGLTSLETVFVGDPGNVGELSGVGAGGEGVNRVCGAVSYNYSIGKYKVTAGQYCEFLNAVAKTDTYGLYNTSMGLSPFGCKIQRSYIAGVGYSYTVASDYANRPVSNVSWGDAARFANWLHNGQPTGAQGLSTTENGAYYLNGATSHEALDKVSRNTNWKWAITNEDEWYKAAYYKGGGTNAGYWDYATSSNSNPGRDMTETTNPGNNANYFSGSYLIGSPY
jgi:formylglycine-generating enzyme